MTTTPTNGVQVTASDLTPGDVLKTATGPYRIDWLRHTFGGVEVHNRSDTSRVLWLYPHQAVETVGRAPVVPPQIPTFRAKPTPEAA